MDQVMIKRKLNNIDQVMNIDKLNKFNLLKEDLEEVILQSKKFG